MSFKRHAVVLMILAVATGGAAALLAADAKPKTEITQDTPENALKSYVTCWQNVDFAGIMACIKVSDPAKKEIVERYISYMMWYDMLERACVAKFGEDEGLKAHHHVRTLTKQYELDKKRAVAANVEYDSTDRTRARMFLKVEKDRPEGLHVDELTFRDEYSMAKEGGVWKVDFLKTYKLNDPEPSSVEEVKYYAYKAYPVITKKMKELTEEVKAGKITGVDDVQTAIKNEWEKLNPE